MTAFSQWMADIQQRTESALDRALPPADIAPTRLHEAMRYAVLGGGKRVRPLLVHAGGQLSGRRPERLDRVSCALEMIHAYSSSMTTCPAWTTTCCAAASPPCTSSSTKPPRCWSATPCRPRPSSTSPTPRSPTTPRQIAMIRQLAQATGPAAWPAAEPSTSPPSASSSAWPSSEFMHIHKTGALIRASINLGVQCGRTPTDEMASLDHVGKVIGLLFQVVDDILDAEADTATWQDRRQGRRQRQAHLREPARRHASPPAGRRDARTPSTASRPSAMRASAWPS